MLLAALVVPWASRAQETVTIGTGTSTSYYVPFNSLYWYSFSEWVYPATEINMAGSITTIRFHLGTSSTAQTNNYTIWMKNVSRSSFSSDTDYETVNASDVVFSGSWTIPGSYTGWVEIQLDTPFQYDGDSNLVIAMHEYTSGYSSRYFTYTSVTNAGFQLYSDSANPDPYNISSYSGNKSTRSYLPNIQLEITAGTISCYPVKDLAITESTIESLTLSWLDTSSTSSAATYTVYSVTDSDTVVLQSGITDTFFTVNNLTGNTPYTFGVAADCGDGDLSSMRFVSGRTACVAVTEFPWRENFDSYTTAGELNIPCWVNERIVDGTGNGTLSVFKISTTAQGGHTTSMLQLPDMKAGTRTKLVLPQMTFPDDNYMLSIDVYRNATGTSNTVEGIRIFASTDGEIQGATELAFISRNYTVTDSNLIPAEPAAGWYTYEIPIGISGTGYIIFRGESNYGGATYMDSLVVKRIPTCITPRFVTVVDSLIDATEATVTWVSTASNFQVDYKAADDSVWTTMNVTETEALITGLQPNTAYEVRVKALCSDTDESEYCRVVNFITRCVPLGLNDLPYTYNFDDATGTGATHEIDQCWGRYVQGSTTRYPNPSSTYKNSGTYSLYMYNTSTVKSWATLPVLDASVDANTLMVAFYAYKSSASYGRLKVGVMTDPEDYSTFVPVASVQPSATSTWEYFEIPLGNYTGLGAYVTIMADSNATNYTYVDDVKLMVTPGCARVEAIDVAPTSDGGILTITDPTDVNNYIITVTHDSLVFNYTSSSTTFQITGLEANTPYDISVYSDCGDGTTTTPRSSSFRTACLPISELPWFDDFESHPTGAAPLCWYSMQGNNTVMSSAAIAHSGTNRLDFRGNTAGNVVLLPDLGEELSWNDVSLNFWTRPESTSSSCGIFMVGYFMENEDNDTVFVWLDSLSYADFPVVSYRNVDVSFADMPDGARPAFFHLPNATNYYWYVDDVSLYMTPSCPRVQSIGVANLTNESVDVVVRDTNEVFSYYMLLSHDSVVEEYSFNDTVYSLTELLPNTEYTMVLSTDCGEDTTLPMSYTFRTYCDPVEEYPFEENFDSLTGGSSASADCRMDIPCWFFPYRSSANYPYITNSTTYNANGGNCVYTNTSTVIVLPFFSHTPAELMVEFDVRVATANYGLEVGYVTDPYDRTTFVPVTTCIPTTTGVWQHFSSTFAGINEGLIAFRTVGSTAYLDNVVVDELPACVAPSAVTFTGIDSASATINIADANETDHYSVVMGEETFEVNGNTLPLTNLTPNTEYTVVVRTYCLGGTLSEDSTVATFRTKCGAVSLPFFEDFNDLTASYNSNTNGMIPCWDINKSAQVSYLTAVTSGNYLWEGASLKFYPGDATAKTIIVLPRFDMAISELELAFQTRPEGTSSSSGSFDVGYMTDVNIDTTFVVLQHYDYSDFSGAYQMKVVHFENAPENARIAMRHNAAASMWFWFVDDVNVYEAPACFAPQSVWVDNISTTDATIHVVDSNNNGNYICYLDNGTTVDTVSIVDDSVIMVNNLLPSTPYTLRVVSLCEDGTTTSYVQTSFNTQCGPISLPASFDPDRYATGSSNIPYCWTRNCNGTTSSNYPYIYSSSTNAHTGSNVLYYYFTTTSGYPTQEIMALPEIDTVNFPMNRVDVSFWAKSSPAGRHFVVGVMSDPSNDSTFQAIDTLRLTTTSTKYTVELGAFTGTGAYVALKAYKDTTTYSYIYVDDISLEVGSPCARSRNLTASNATTTSVDLGWTDVVTGYTQWKVRYALDTVDTWTEITVNSNPYTLTGLTANTIYRFVVAPVCADGQTAFFSRDTLRFNTSQMPATVPYSYDFEAAAEWNNWQTGSNNAVNWYRGIVANGDTTNTMYLSADSGATNSWTRNVITNVAAYRDIDFGTGTHSYTLTFKYRGGGHLTSVTDGVAVLLVDPATVADIPNNYLGSPWGNIRWVHARKDSVWTEKTVQFDGVSGVKRLVFYHFNNASTTGYMDIPPAIDDIAVVMQVCDRPYDLTSTDVTPNSVSLHWEGDDTATYIVDYRLAGTTGGDLFDTVVGLSHTVTGLAANTSYSFWVKKRCDDTTYSNWTSNITVRTLCGYESVPFLEDFESYTGSTYSTAGVLPDCWESYTNGTSDVYYPHITGSGLYSYPHSGTNCLTMTSSGSTATYGTTKVVALPPFATPLNQLVMSFWYRMENAAQGTLTVGYVTDVNNLDGSFVAVKTIAGTTTVTQDTVTFDSVTATNVQIAFRWYKESTYYSVGIDDISVWVAGAAPQPVCNAPDSIVVDTVTYNSAQVTWNEVANSLHQYEIAWMLGEWSEPTSSFTETTTTHTITNLWADTVYYFGVRTICDEGLTSDWAVIPIHTAQVPCTEPTNVAVSNVSYNSATISFTPGMEQTQWEVHVFGGANINRTETVTTTTVNIDNLVINETYQVAVRALCSGNRTSDWSDTVSFTTLNCMAPTNVNVDQITAITAHVTWTGSASAYKVEYGYAGFGHGDAIATIPATGNSVDLTGLDPETMYDVYVISVCAEGVESVWSLKETFTTLEYSGNYYTLTVVSNNPAWGTVTGGSEYPEGYVATITATPNSGYRFVEWQEDHDTNSIRNVTVTGDATYTAIFAQNVGIDEAEMSEVSLFPNPASSMVTIRANGMEQVSVIDLNGSTVMMQSVDSETFTFDVSNLAKGAYFVRITGGEGTVVRKLIVK